MLHNAGGEISLHALLRRLQDQGHDCIALVAETTDVPSYHLDGVEVVTTSSPREAKAAPFEYFQWADVCLTQLTSSYRAGLLGRMTGTPVVHYAHNDGSYTARMLATQSDAAIYNTEWVRRSCQEQGAWTPGEILHPVVDPAEYATDGERRYVTLINLSTGEDNHYDKGQATFFELARRNPTMEFLGVRGAYGVQGYVDLPNVSYLDHTDDITSVYAQTRVLLVPSKYESYGRVAVEAAASGIPSICTPTPGLVEAMGDAALYADYGNYDSWNAQLYAAYWRKRLICGEPLQRSAFLYSQSQQELADVELMFQIIHEGGLQDYYNFKDV
ncbi:glycosyltransferase family 4 protein [Plantactinospora solaniradicis]|uniref:Glycosyltransferase family 4 protein n=1 Tax=Plantactinospora solaniradicis TaxID=1723736 RepID=A0ABW1KIE0_9ACTN